MDVIRPRTGERRMNVAYVSNVVYPFVTGGAEKRIHEIGSRLAERGHDVTVYGRHYWDGPSKISHEGMQLRGVAGERDLYVDGRRSIPEAVRFAGAVWGPLRRHVDDHDVVVASVFPYFPVLSASAATWRTGVVLVTTWHECWRGYWWEYLGPLGVGGMAVERLVARLPQYPIAVSSVTADRLAGVGTSRDRISVIHNGVDVDRIRALEPTSEGFDLLFVGRLVEAKRVDLLLRAVARRGIDARLGIVGDGPARDGLERLAAELELTDAVTFLGHVPAHEDVVRHMRAADVFVSPSTREGFGISVLEALAAECRVVAVDHPNSAAAEVVDGAGILVEPTPDALGSAIERAIDGEGPGSDPSTRVARFDWEAVTDRAEVAYRRAIQDDW